MSEHVIRYYKDRRQFELEGDPLRVLQKEPVVVETYHGTQLLAQAMLRLVREGEGLKVEAFVTDEKKDNPVISMASVVPFKGEYHGNMAETATEYQNKSLSTVLRSVVSHAFFNEYPDKPLSGVIEQKNVESLKPSLLTMDPENNQIYEVTIEDADSYFHPIYKMKRRKGKYTTLEKALAQLKAETNTSNW